MPILLNEIRSMGLEYFDWNVTSGSAAATGVTRESVYNNVISGVADQPIVNILFHDTRPVAEALPAILDKLILQGYIFRTVSKDSYPIRFKD